jgi:hypothetical protein
LRWLRPAAIPDQAASGGQADEPALNLFPCGAGPENVSCVSRTAIAAHVQHGRVFLRNVRHGLYLVPLSLKPISASAARLIRPLHWVASAARIRILKNWKLRRAMV